MIFPYPRLYLRLAIYIGAALLAFSLLGAATLALIASYELRGYISARQSPLAAEAAEVLAGGGRSALSEWLAGVVAARDDVNVFVLDGDANDILDRPLPGQLAGFVRNSVVGRDEPTADNLLPLRLAPQIVAPDGEILTFLVLPRGITFWGSPSTVLGLVLSALLVTAAVAWLIARVFSRPIGALQRAVRELASGNLAAQLPKRITGRADELGALAADFNRMARQLDALIAGREQLMQELSHELRAPLARLQAALALASQRESLTDEERRQIDAEIAQMDRVIGELLRFSSLNTVDVAARRLFRLDRLLGKLLDSERVEAGAVGCELRLATDEGLTLVGDPELLQRGIENVLRNAIRHAPAGTVVDVSARREDGEICLRIEDRGPGVPAQYITRIFEPFVRVPGAAGEGADAGKGSGLGLAIARRVFELHEGRIEASPRDGGGLVVIVRLPEADLR